MVTIRGNASFAFSIKNNEEKDSPSQEKEEPEQIQGSTSLTADLIQFGKSVVNKFKNLQDRFQSSTLFSKREYRKQAEQIIKEVILDDLESDEIVESAIIPCFKLLDKREKDIKKYYAMDGEVEFNTPEKDFIFTYKQVESNQEAKILREKTNPSTELYAYEIHWVIFNLSWGSWRSLMRKGYEFAFDAGISSLIPFIGRLIGNVINKKIKQEGDQQVIDDINAQFNKIFYKILISSENIAMLKYQNKKLILN